MAGPRTDEDRAVSVLTLAFSADPIVRWAYPDAHKYYLYFPAFVRAFAGKAFDEGTAFIAADYAGAALWLPPGVHADDEPLSELVAATVDAAVQEPLSELMEQQARLHPAEPHWYLPLIGVDPARQRQGHGAGLLQQALAACDREELPAYLEATSEGSRALYERHGFDVVDEIQVQGSPPMWPMLRRPRA
jgi:ribosomal protein S18 acetylase RimI-like enzyme